MVHFFFLPLIRLLDIARLNYLVKDLPEANKQLQAHITKALLENRSSVTLDQFNGDLKKKGEELKEAKRKLIRKQKRFKVIIKTMVGVEYEVNVHPDDTIKRVVAKLQKHSRKTGTTKLFSNKVDLFNPSSLVKVCIFL